MTALLILVGVLLVGATGRLLAQAIALPRLRVKTHLRALDEYGYDAGVHTEPAQKKPLKEVVAHLADRVGRSAMAKWTWPPPLQSGDLNAAGFYEITPERVHGYRVMAATLIPGVLLLLMLAGGSGLSLMTGALLLAAAAAGWQLPAFSISRRGAKRLDDVDRQLPELIDLLIATVEAGMGIAGSIDLVADRFQGALGEELRLTVKQQRLGISSAQALGDMVERCDTPALKAFVRTIVRAESLGVSIGPILRELAGDMRRRRRMAAKEKMQKAPVKMLFPLMFLIMPALMIEILFPAGYSILHNLSGF